MPTRVLEPEVMESDDDAREYNAMDHSAVNAQFVTDLLAALADRSLQRTVKGAQILDLGAGTAQIPIELCRRDSTVKVVAVDAAASMLAIAEKNIATEGFSDRIALVLADAKELPFESGSFPVVISNSILHHIAEPRDVIAEAIRVAGPVGFLFHRDLTRPRNEIELQQLVATYAGGADDYQRKLFADSLRAALTLTEVRQLVAQFGFAPDTVRMTSDRHWTWTGSVPSISARW